jgi:hypothetical protein
MAVANDIPVDAARRRRRRAALALALMSAVLGSAFVADRLLNGKGEETAWTTDTVFPKLARYIAKPHGVTVPISRRVVHRTKAQGGPEDPGAYIEEAPDGWLLADGQTPADGFARTGFSLPSHTPFDVGGFRFAPGGGGGGGGGGSDGGLALSCPDDAEAILALTGKGCADTGSNPDPAETAESPETPGDGGLTILPIVASSSPPFGGVTGPEGNGSAGPGNTDGAPATPVTAVPEPQNWALMIAGFFLAGMAIRSGRAKTRLSFERTR